MEGRTEILFVEKLLLEIAGSHLIQIDSFEVRGGASCPRTVSLIRATKSASGQKYYVLLYDCGGDEPVAQRIRDEHVNLTNLKYSKIIGIRDVRPQFAYADIPNLEAALPRHLNAGLIPVEFILSVMEIEAWFLAEYNHFPKIDPSITVAAIQAALGFDPANDDLSNRGNPTADIDACYRIGGKAYSKPAGRTVGALDYTFMYYELKNKIPYLRKLVDSIDAFLI